MHKTNFLKTNKLGEKSLNIKERILQFAKFQGATYEKFFPTIGMTYGSFTGSAKDRPLNSNAIKSILTKYPALNPEWLLTGKGSMLKQESNTVKGRAETHGINEGEATPKPTSDALSDVQKLALYILENIDEMEKEPIFMNYIKKKAYEIATDFFSKKFPHKP